MRRREVSPLLRERDVATFVAGRVVTEIGSRITREGLPVAAILAASATASELGLLALVSTLPALVLGTTAGAVADRTRRRPLMIAADFVRTGLLLTVPLAAVAGRLTFAQVAAVTALVAAVTVFFQVADRAYLPSLVTLARVGEANSLLAAADGVGETIGPGLMGVLVQAFGVPLAIVGDALSYAVSGVSLLLIRRSEPPPAPASADGRPRAGLLDGLRAVAAHPVLRPLAGLVATQSVFGGFFGALYELYALKTLHLSPFLLGLLITCGGLGSLVGSTLWLRLSVRAGLGRVLLVSFALSALANILVPAAPSTLFAAFAFLWGAQFFGDMFGTVFAIGTATVEQRVTPGSWLGRVEGALQTLGGGLGAAGAVAAGLIATAVGMRTAFWISAAGGMLAVAWLLTPRMRRLDLAAAGAVEWPGHGDTQPDRVGANA